MSHSFDQRLGATFSQSPIAGNGDHEAQLYSVQNLSDDILVREFSESASATLPAFSSTVETTHRVIPSNLRLIDYFTIEESPRERYTDLEIQDITRLLRESNREAWSQVPRLYIVLRIIGQLQILDTIMDLGITDVWFPFAPNSVPRVLSADLKARFVETQPLVLTKGLDLEKGEGTHHAHFGRDELFPFHVMDKLGSGGYGSVDKIYSPLSRREFARKRFARGKRGEKDKVRSFRTELQILKRIRHHHCVELVASYTDTKFFGLIMSPVADCNLETFYQMASTDDKKKRQLSEFFGCLASGLNYLHSSSIRHRDVKPENILVKAECVYLTDFGISLDWKSLSRSTTTEDAPKTVMYCAPEVAAMESRNSSSDVWSLGCIFLEMFTVLSGRSINDLRAYFEEHTNTRKFYCNIKSMEDWLTSIRDPKSAHSNLPVTWIAAMTSVNATSRPTAQEIYATIASIPRRGYKRQATYCGDCCAFDFDGESMGESTDNEHKGGPWVKDDVVTSPPATDAVLITSGPPLEPVMYRNIGDAELYDSVSSLDEGVSSVTDTHISGALNQANSFPDNPSLPSLATPPTLKLIKDLKKSNTIPQDSAFSAVLPIEGVTPESLPPSSSAKKSVIDVQVVEFTAKEPVEPQSTTEWPEFDLNGQLPLLVTRSWTSPTNFLKSVQEDFHFLGWTSVNVRECFDLVSNAKKKDITMMLKMFIRQGLNVNDKKFWKCGITPFHLVLSWQPQTSYLSTIELLLDSGAEFIEDWNEATPLTYAAFFGAADAAKKILRKFPDINIDQLTTDRGFALEKRVTPVRPTATALGYAVMGVRTVPLFSGSAAGETALTLAQKGGHSEIVEILKKAKSRQ